MCNEGKSEGDRDLQVEAALSGVFNSLHVHNYVAGSEGRRKRGEGATAHDLRFAVRLV